MTSFSNEADKHTKAKPEGLNQMKTVMEECYNLLGSRNCVCSSLDDDDCRWKVEHMIENRENKGKTSKIESEAFSTFKL